MENTANRVDEDGRQLAQQSPNWDATLRLSDMFSQAKFLILRRESVELVNVVFESKTANGYEVYHNYGLSHDRYGVTYESDCSIRADYIQRLIESGKAEITKDANAALRHIWECMNCQPFSAFSEL